MYNSMHFQKVKLLSKNSNDVLTSQKFPSYSLLVCTLPKPVLTFSPNLYPEAMHILTFNRKKLVCSKYFM